MPFKSARSTVHLDDDTLVLELPTGWTERFILDGMDVEIVDGFVAVPRSGGRVERRFVRMLELSKKSLRFVLLTPPEDGMIAPNIVRIPEAPYESAILATPTWEAVAEWLIGGGRLGALAVADLARLACIATPQFAAMIGEVAARRALDLVWVASGPLRGVHDLDAALQPLSDAARHSTRAAEALVAALAHAAGLTKRKLRR
ncbi:MAG: hypothetical protein QM831_21895 [Kofleriaceae bacterium]